MTDFNNIVKKFRNQYTDQKNFNVGIMLSDIDFRYIKILTTIPNLKLYSLDDNLNNPKCKNLTQYFNAEYNILTAIKSMHLIITNNVEITDFAEDLGVKTFSLFKNKKTSKYKNVKFFSCKNIEKTFVKIKKDTNEYRLNLREKFLLSQIDIIKKNKIINTLTSQYQIYDVLFEEICKDKYIDKLIKISSKLSKLPETKLLGKSLTAEYTGIYKNKIQSSLKNFEKILPELTEQQSYLLYTYACLNFKAGNFKEFEKYYWSKYLKPTETYFENKYKKPHWKGEKDVRDKVILAYALTGFGDNFIFLKHIKELNKIFKKVILIAHPKTYNLLKENFSEIEVVEKDFDKVDYDYITDPMSVIVHLKLLKHQKNKWIKPDKQKIKEYKKYFDKNKFNIGVFWDSTRNKLKRWSDLETFMPLAYLDKVQLYSLHVDKEDFELNYLDDSVHIENLGKHFKDFSDTAAAIENCDLIVSTDSVILNLAGAMGKKTFGLFPEFTEFRWYKLDGEDVGWYKSVKPFHAEHENNFKPEISKICEEVKELIKQNDRFK